MTHFAFVSFLTYVRAPLVLLGTICALVNLALPHIGWLFAMVLLFALSAITDLFDGKLARKWNVCSRLGALADPLMDKVFFLLTLPAATFIALYSESTTHGLVLLILDVLCMLRDQWVSFMRSVGSEYGAEVKADWAGKVRTALGFPILILVHIHLALDYLVLRNHESYNDFLSKVLPIELIYSLEAIFFLLTVYTLVHYTRSYAPYLRRAATPGNNATK